MTISACVARPSGRRDTRSAALRVTPVIPHDLRRTSRLTLARLALRRRWGWLLGAAVLLAVGAFVAAVPWNMLARDARIDAEGARADGEIQILTTAVDAEDRTDYVVKYTVVLPSGGAVWGRGVATKEDWRALRVGDVLAVRYDPAHPETNFPADPRYSLGRVRTPGYAAMISACGLPFLILGGLIVWGLVVRLPAAWHRLLARGASADGTVVAVEPQTDADGDPMPEWRLRYAFRDRFGTEREGETESGPRSLVDGWAAGDAGTVQFDPRDPEASVWLGKGDLAFFR